MGKAHSKVRRELPATQGPLTRGDNVKTINPHLGTLDCWHGNLAIDLPLITHKSLVLWGFQSYRWFVLCILYLPTD